IKRTGGVVGYDEEKIVLAISRAYLAVEGGQVNTSPRVREQSEQIAASITEILNRRRGPSLGSSTIHIEDIQDLVELSLMRSGAHKVARSYVLYREERTKDRLAKENKNKKKATESDDSIIVSYGKHRSAAGQEQRKLPKSFIKDRIVKACADVNEVSSDALYEDCLKAIYPGIFIDDVTEAMIMSSRTFIEREPQYAYVTARLLLDKLTNKALQLLSITTDQSNASESYQAAFIASIKFGCKEGLLDSKLLEFKLEELAKAIMPERDNQFTYLGLQTLYDRYFLHKDDVRFELPQVFFMRVAMGLSINEPERESKTLEFYNQLSEFNYMSSTPTLFNSGTIHSQMSSCYLTTIADDLSGIYKSMGDNAMLSKWAGGLGNDWTPVRAMGAYIKGTNGRSQGVVPFLKVANDTAIAVNQGGKRKGALCSYLESWHLDIEEFLELRKNTGDDRRRTHDMNTANWVPDLFMKRVMEDGQWTLFSPSDVLDLHDSYGKEFEEKYCAYEKMVEEGQLTTFKQISAKVLWRKMLSMLFETGHPWITFKDVCNLRSPQQHCGVIHSSNLCTEITLNTSADEIAVCNLGSINLTRYFDAKGELDKDKLRDKVRTAIRMLDNVIDINYYPVREARDSNFKHRPIGLGIMGFQDVLYMKRIPLASDEAVEFSDQLMEHISYYAIEASSDLAAERGAYPSYEGSLWSQGILPIDSLKILEEARGKEYIDLNMESTLDWDSLRNKIAKQKMRNSNVLAIAPTATIANITGVVASIEPTFQNLYVKSNLSGEFTCVNEYLAKDLKKIKAWDNVMINDLKYYEGGLSEIGRIPQDLKDLYATAFEIDPKWLIKLAARRQKWIDQAQSLNLYIDKPSGMKLDEMYKFAWVSGVKTTYYLRSRSATKAEKSTIDRGRLNNVDIGKLKESAVSLQDVRTNAVNDQDTTTNIKVDGDFTINENASCSLDDPECESCQ
ncbi:MAG: ribonucleoside-diphosphate reductase subunit alpha, partial [Candidatus Portiera sp.]|nr:ribonucleoside-diphosphate reductase subunit alpha [Portiera sp.]